MKSCAAFVVLCSKDCVGFPRLLGQSISGRKRQSNHRSRWLYRPVFCLGTIGPNGHRPFSEREAEIASKVSRLRNRKGLNKVTPATHKTDTPEVEEASKGSKSYSLSDNRNDNNSPLPVNPSSASKRPEDDSAAVPSSSGLQNTPSPRVGGPVHGNQEKSAVSSFETLPDWKKQEILRREMATAESFLKFQPVVPSPQSIPVRPSPSHERFSSDMPRVENIIASPPAHTSTDMYKPKIRTWGMFPRPDNISEAYGGGRNLPLGGKRIPPDDPETIRCDKATQEALARYRKGQGIDVEREQMHEPEIVEALNKAKAYMTRALPYDAVHCLERVQDYVSPRSKRGGDVLMNLAFAYEATGQRERARQVYVKLKSSPFQHVARQARHLLSGFEAMEKLRLVDTTSDSKLCVTTFRLPEVARYTEKRYETAYMPQPNNQRAFHAGSIRTDGDSDQLPVETIVVLLLIGLPIAFIILQRLNH